MYYLSEFVNMSFEDAVGATREALKCRDFKVLAEIDLAEVLRMYLPVGSRPYAILATCNPRLAHRAIRADAEIGSIVFCNFVVHQCPDGRVEISAADPAATIGTINDVELMWVARELRSMVRHVIKDVASRPAPRSALGHRKQADRQLARILPKPRVARM
jgi:uncharacterized protein (DUF302 family)